MLIVIEKCEKVEKRQALFCHGNVFTKRCQSITLKSYIMKKYVGSIIIKSAYTKSIYNTHLLRDMHEL
jgi:hypothetical protein